MVLHHLLHPLLIIFALFSTTTSPQNFPIAKPHCLESCGDIHIPFPFGAIENCSLSLPFFMTCNKTFTPWKLFWADSTIQITNISLDGQIKLMHPIASHCYAPNGTLVFSSVGWLRLAQYFTFNYTNNKFTIVGCDTVGSLSWWRLDCRTYKTDCSATCFGIDDLEGGTCMGLGCCQTSIPQNVKRVDIDLQSYDRYTKVYNITNCGYAFLAEDTAFSFSRESVNSLKNVSELPMLVDWAIGSVKSCEEARMNSSAYACRSRNSVCFEPGNGAGYRCHCADGYQGNPYLDDGCRDECQLPYDLRKCNHTCVNTIGGFNCSCPKGYYGDEKIGEGCIRRRHGDSEILLKVVTASALGFSFLILLAGWLYLALKRKSSNKMKQKFFLQNGGPLLQEKLISKGRSPDAMRVFSSSELQKATNNFDNNMIIGQGGFGTVYKGFLLDNTIIAIKKSKRIDPNQIEQFINEVIVLSQINHRNVVSLLGCCLETEVPLLVYKFISNGTLSTHIHNQAKARLFNWDVRLKIAAEIAGVLTYLHSAASTPIIHRDVKSDNILLDHTFTAKVSDFGASKLVPLDHTQLSTIVQGTFGYLDPEYMQTNQLTEKSDVYSFGVVLLELLTGRKAISFDKPENEKNLANFFLSMFKQEKLFQVLDENILCDKNREQITEVARLAQGCLNVKGEDRPTMKEVAMELEGLRLGGRHSWTRTDHNAEEMEYLLGEGSSSLASGDGNSTSVGYDSLKDHVLLPIRGGR